MTATQILKWAELGASLITVLGVPVANVIALFKGAGGTDEEAEALIGHWAALGASVEARIRQLGGGG